MFAFRVAINGLPFRPVIKSKDNSLVSFHFIPFSWVLHSPINTLMYSSWSQYRISKQWSISEQHYRWHLEHSCHPRKTRQSQGLPNNSTPALPFWGKSAVYQLDVIKGRMIYWEKPAISKSRNNWKMNTKHRISIIPPKWWVMLEKAIQNPWRLAHPNPFIYEQTMARVWFRWGWLDRTEYFLRKIRAFSTNPTFLKFCLRHCVNVKRPRGNLGRISTFLKANPSTLVLTLTITVQSNPFKGKPHTSIKLPVMPWGSVGGGWRISQANSFTVAQDLRWLSRLHSKVGRGTCRLLINCRDESLSCNLPG